MSLWQHVLKNMSVYKVSEDLATNSEVFFFLHLLEVQPGNYSLASSGVWSDWVSSLLFVIFILNTYSHYIALADLEPSVSIRPAFAFHMLELKVYIIQPAFIANL